MPLESTVADMATWCAIGGLVGSRDQRDRFREVYQMKRETCTDLAVATLLVVAGVVLRIMFQNLPNVAPVAALALFSGYHFRHWAGALSVPLAIMAISDRLLGGYEGLLMLAVYGMLALPVAMRPVLRGKLARAFEPARLSGSALRLAGCSLVASLAFFVVTNGVCWWVSGRYALTLGGLGECFWQALPFFRYTLVGDLLFTLGIFATYAAIRWLGAVALSPRAVPLKAH